MGRCLKTKPGRTTLSGAGGGVGEGPRGGAAGAETQEGSQRGEGKVPEPEDPGLERRVCSQHGTQRRERSGAAGWALDFAAEKSPVV